MIIRPVEVDTKEQKNGKPLFRKPYNKPGIIHDLELETRAGSPIPLKIDPLNPDSWGSDGS
jgi:hypothetical protein